MLLKVVLFAYSRGIVSSRRIERACRDHVTFIALSGDSAPHFAPKEIPLGDTTFADFVSTLGNEIGSLFKEVLLICDRQGLIGREMFAIDGVKLPSNASKAKSGTRADFARHRENDALSVEPTLAEKEARQIERLTRESTQMRQWLAANPDERKGAKGKVIKSNRTDNESAKMATSKGVIQGYTGVAAVDARHQIIIEAQAHGTGSEQALLMPMVEAAASQCTPDTLITADAGYHSEANIKALAEQDRPALIADNQMRKRDERFKDQDKYKALPDPLYDKAHPKKGARHYRPADFSYDADAGTCICPAGKSLYQNGANCKHNSHLAVKFQGALRDCVPCTQRDKCLRKPDTTQTRQVSFFYGKTPAGTVSYIERMKRAIRNAGEPCMADASPRWSRCLATSATTRGWTASRCAGKKRWIRNGSSTAWCTI